jgi:predicted MPP superfamily phosphohydrolase
VLGAAEAVYALLIEPNWIEVTRGHVYVQAPAGALARPLKIAHLSDLHTPGMGRRERRLLTLIEAEQPDLIVVTGDTLAKRGTYEAVHQLLSRLHAPLGVWVVRGNWENWRPVKNERTFYGSTGVNFLLNEARPVREGIWIVGLDDPSTGSPDLEAALQSVPPGAFTITLFHSPAYFDQIAARCPLVLAGHTHGGQVRIPLVPPLWLQRGSGRFLAGWYRRGDAQMYIPRGIGTSILPIRFLCRPELAIITVER